MEGARNWHWNQYSGVSKSMNLVNWDLWARSQRICIFIKQPWGSLMYTDACEALHWSMGNARRKALKVTKTAREKPGTGPLTSGAQPATMGLRYARSSGAHTVCPLGDVHHGVLRSVWAARTAGWLRNNRNSVLTALEAGRSKIKVLPAHSVSGRSFLVHRPLSPCCAFTWKNG